MQGVLLPPDIVKVHGPVIFLAGPIQGARDWQLDAIGILRWNGYTGYIANPRRQYLDGDFVYAAQVDWETVHLRRAGLHGVILFWLSREIEHNPTRAFAQTSRFEIGEWFAKVLQNNRRAKLVIGIEEGFSGARYIQHRFAQARPDVPIFRNLDDTCYQAVELIRRGLS